MAPKRQSRGLSTDVKAKVSKSHVDKKSREAFEIRTDKRLADILEPIQQTVDALMKLDLPASADVEVRSSQKTASSAQPEIPHVRDLKYMVVPSAQAKSSAGARRAAASDAVSVQGTQADILRLATEIIGSQDAAMRWMGTPVRALNYATPISMLHDESGFEAVRVVLGRLEHGVL
jgi:uncharacterized protein (DUF2384 family)